ncbi:MAG: hypothetical protein M1815_000311 [Lichina confinis]|nr:MAG: hypothetical protein M1815_000311 [Lichina confinis]
MAPKIHRRNMRSEFDVLRVLDAGDGDGPGALNGGIYVVRRKVDGLVCAEKRVTPENVARGFLIDELVILRKLHHRNITRYVDAFLCPESPVPAASLYMELCELGSMEDLLKRWKTRCALDNRRHVIPEAFVWHSFHCLMKALTYLRYGFQDGRDFAPVDGWKPVFHRDIKPGNVLLRTPDGGGKYPTVVLGDFGIAIAHGSTAWGTTLPCGTINWQPPELPENDMNGRSDVWTVGAVIQSMCWLDDGPLTEPPPGVWPQDWARNPRARQPRGAGPFYSPELHDVVMLTVAPDVQHRPEAGTMLLQIKDSYVSVEPKFKRLPSWAFD